MPPQLIIFSIYITGLVILLFVNQILKELDNSWHLKSGEDMFYILGMWPVMLPLIAAGLLVFGAASVVGKVFGGLAKKTAVLIQRK